MKPEMYVLLVLSAVAIGFIALDRIAFWMERRGWIRPRQKRAGGGRSLSGALTGLQQFVEPQVEHRVQVMEERNESIGQRLGRGDGIDVRYEIRDQTTLGDQAHPEKSSA